MWSNNWLTQYFHCRGSRIAFEMTQSLPQPPAVDADEIISDFASWDLPGDLDNWFLVIDTIQTADTPRLRETAAQIRTHLESAKAKLKVLERQWLEPDMLWLL